ncbi:transcription factor GTE4 isoform X2 [Vigna unguiculata]|uniref:transcription factor GTE4 isoform X2 n=1 Tax=Vigna unguiculata TaxID=3917 RepID=UPI001016C691|nr:transcription factor GTE4 isoform X2 [Vigna unguiculata]
MASGQIGGDDGSKKEQRYTESKVYTRKAFKGPRNKANANAVNVAPRTTAATFTGDDSSGTITAAHYNSRDNITVDNGNPRAKDNCNNALVQQDLEDGNSVRPQHVNGALNDPSGIPGIPEWLPGPGSFVRLSLDWRSKPELMRRLESELNMVRSLVSRIEEKLGVIGAQYGISDMMVDSGTGRRVGTKRTHSEVASAVVPPREPSQPLHQLSVSVLENSQGVGETIEKEKRTPKANQFYRNSEFLLGKEKFPPSGSNKKSKLNGKKHGAAEMGHGMGLKLLKSCGSLLEKLMKHKHGWVFNTPVDVEGLGLHDYFDIIKHPMDLGAVKSRLNKNLYKSPKEFAEDVRLTFRNAMTYNPKGQDVHIMAEQLSDVFEERWAVIESNYNHEMRFEQDYGAAGPSPSPLSRKAPGFRPPPIDMRRILDRSESMTQPQKNMSITPSSRTPAPKKPKAKDPHKRDMTYEEKQKLSTNLQGLPSEKLDAIVQIIKKRNSALSQHDEEIEVDIDSVDTETLWELDRFVTNYKKSLSKNKRKLELAIQARAQAEQNALQKSQAPVMVEISKEAQTDERNSPPSLPAQEEVQADGSKTSGSSSSSSDSGSSSSVTLINYLVKRYLNLYYSCYCMLTSAFRFGQVFCLIYIILFVQILILVVPQPLGLMLGNREPKFILSDLRYLRFASDVILG